MKPFDNKPEGSLSSLVRRTQRPWWYHHRNIPVFNAVPSERIKTTGIQYCICVNCFVSLFCTSDCNSNIWSVTLQVLNTIQTATAWVTDYSDQLKQKHYVVVWPHGLILMLDDCKMIDRCQRNQTQYLSCCMFSCRPVAALKLTSVLQVLQSKVCTMIKKENKFQGFLTGTVIRIVYENKKLFSPPP